MRLSSCFDEGIVFMENFFLEPSNQVQSDDQRPIGFFFHVITITITCTILFLSMKLAVSQPTPAEPLFLIKPLTPQKIDETANIPTVVTTGLSIYKYRNFDIVNNNFLFEGTIWFEFDPILISLDTISKFRFEKGEILHISPAKTRIVHDKNILALYDIVVKFETELDYKLFPLEDHIVSLVLINHKVSPQELIFESDKQSFIVDENTRSHGWIQAFEQVETGYIEERLDEREFVRNIEHPGVQFSLLYRRAGLKNALILLMPMLVFIIIMLTAFSYDPQKYFSSIMVANGASLSGLIGFRFVIEGMSPKVGYFMVSDYFFIVFLALAAILFLIGIFSLKLNMRVKKMLILIVHGLLITAFLAITIYILSFTFHGVEIF